MVLERKGREEEHCLGAGCSIIIEPGREYKQVAKNNIDEIVPQQ
jgi:hypothetical protein